MQCREFFFSDDSANSATTSDEDCQGRVLANEGHHPDECRLAGSHQHACRLQWPKLMVFLSFFSFADIQLENYDRVAKLRETLIHSLQECVSILRPQSVVQHLSQLLLCLPLLRQLDSVTRHLWLSVLKEGSVHMNKLFIEMLETRF